MDAHAPDWMYAGVAGIPIIGFDIGREEDAHTVDESIAIADLLTAARGYQGIIHSVCHDQLTQP